MSLTNIGGWADALEPIANKSFAVGFREYPVERDAFYTVPSRKAKKTETMLEMGDIGIMGQLSGDLEYESLQQGYKMTITQEQYAKGIMIERQFKETDQLDIVEGLPRMLGLAARRRFAVDAVKWFNSATDGSYTVQDGLSLANSAHTSNQPGISTTQSNITTNALNAPNLEAARQAMKGYLSNKDQKINIMPKMIVGGQGIQEVAYEIINASGKVDTAQNNPNFHKGKYDLMISDWISDSNNWALVDPELMKLSNKWFQVVSLEFGRDVIFSNYVACFSAYAFYGFGSGEWRWCYFGNPS